MLGAGLDVMGGISSVEKLILEQGVPAVELKHIATLQEGSKIEKILVFKRAIVDFIWSLFQKQVDIVHIHFASKGSTFRTAIIMAIALIYRKPIVLHSHGAGFHIFYGNLPLFIKKIINFLFSKCDRQIVLSNSWKKFYTTHLGLAAEKIVVMPNPVKIPLQPQGKKQSNTVNFLFLGRIGQRKGAFELIEAFASLNEQIRSIATLTLAGDGDVKQARNLVKKFGITDKITVHDWVNSWERDALLASSDVFVLPSYNEGLPMAIIEAMSFGRAVITTPVGGIPELISHGNNGLLVTPGNIKQLTSAMQSLIEDRELRDSLAVEARKSVAPLDIKQYCLSLMSVYHELTRRA